MTVVTIEATRSKLTKRDYSFAHITGLDSKLNITHNGLAENIDGTLGINTSSVPIEIDALRKLQLLAHAIKGNSSHSLMNLRSGMDLARSYNAIWATKIIDELTQKHTLHDVQGVQFNGKYSVAIRDIRSKPHNSFAITTLIFSEDEIGKRKPAFTRIHTEYSSPSDNSHMTMFNKVSIVVAQSGDDRRLRFGLECINDPSHGKISKITVPHMTRKGLLTARTLYLNSNGKQIERSKKN